MSLLTQFPPINPYTKDTLKVSQIHTLYYEESGNPTGNPIIFLHGGPGGGTSPSDRCYFDPKTYRIILVDQRGSGNSTPSSELFENDLKSLVSDIETLRNHLNIKKWGVFGGSFGSSLSLAYAQSHPNHVKFMILRGIFMMSPSEIQWFYQNGASYLFPDYWEKFIEPIPIEERGDLVSAYYKRLVGDNIKERLDCAKAWSRWECATSRLIVDPELIAKSESDKWALAFARIECHYFINNGFLDDDQLINNVGLIKHIPAVIVQGRYDVVCPMKAAWELSKRWETAELIIIPDAGHSAKEKGTTHALIQATEKFKHL